MTYDEKRRLKLLIAYRNLGKSKAWLEILVNDPVIRPLLKRVRPGMLRRIDGYIRRFDRGHV